MAKTMQNYEAQSAFESASGLPIPAALTLAGPAYLLKKWRQVRQHRRAMAELNRLDDRMLRDIGVNRSEIPRVALFGRDLF